MKDIIQQPKYDETKITNRDWWTHARLDFERSRAIVGTEQSLTGKLPEIVSIPITCAENAAANRLDKIQQRYLCAKTVR